MKRPGVWSDSLRGTEDLFCGAWLEFFSPLRGSNSKATGAITLVMFFFQLNMCLEVLQKFTLLTF